MDLSICKPSGFLRDTEDFGVGRKEEETDELTVSEGIGWEMALGWGLDSRGSDMLEHRVDGVLNPSSRADCKGVESPTDDGLIEFVLWSVDQRNQLNGSEWTERARGACCLWRFHSSQIS